MAYSHGFFASRRKLLRKSVLSRGSNLRHRRCSSGDDSSRHDSRRESRSRSRINGACVRGPGGSLSCALGDTCIGSASFCNSCEEEAKFADELRTSVFLGGVQVDNSRSLAFYMSSSGTVDDMWAMRLQCLESSWFPTGLRRTRSESPHILLWQRVSSLSSIRRKEE